MRAWWSAQRAKLNLEGRSRFGRNVFQVVRANVLAQALPLLAAPLLTRLYTPTDFGMLALFASVLSVALAVGSGRFEWSVPTARSTGMASALVACGSVILAAFVLLILGVLVLAGEHVPPAWAELGPTSLLLPLVVLGGGLQQLIQAWHIRGAELADIGRAKVRQSLANVGISLALAGLPGAGGLFAGVLAGTWVGMGTLWRRARGLARGLRGLSCRRVHCALRLFGREAVWSTLASSANTASFAIVPLLMLGHYGVAEVGYYALMQRVALGPISLVGAAVSQSFWAEAARLVRTDVPMLRRLYLRSSGRLAWAVLPVVAVALTGPWTVGPIFGSANWAEAGWVLAASVPMLVGQAVASPLSHLVIHRRQRWQALWDGARIALLILTIELMGRAQCDFALTVLGLSAVMALMYCVLVLLNLRALRLADD